MSALHSLPTLGDLQRTRRATSKWVTPSRLDERQVARKTAAKQEAAFKAEVWTRDRGTCRHCGRKGIKTMALDPKRGEVHHIHGRGKGLRYEARSAILLCSSCHERVTGRAFHARIIIVARKTFMLNGKRFVDATYPVTFKEAT